MRKFKPKEQKKRRRKLDSQINCSRLEKFLGGHVIVIERTFGALKRKFVKDGRGAGKLHD